MLAIKRTVMGTPAPMPALAPVERPPLPPVSEVVGVGVPVAEDAVVAGMAVEVEVVYVVVDWRTAVFVIELGGLALKLPCKGWSQ